MDRRDGALEDLPPLELRELRALELAEPPDDEHPAHVAAASGVVRRGEWIYVIGDDLTSLATFRVGRDEPGRLIRAMGEQPTGDKHDLEALTVLPPFQGSPYGALLGLGSGSGPERHHGFVCAFAPDGSLDGEPEGLDLGPVYERLAEHVEELNIEGACVMGDRLWLLHRGNHEHTTNVVAELALDEVLRSLRGDRRLDVHELGGLRSYDLGELDGTKLTFSDASPISGEVLVFTASAEAQGDAGPDGAIRGSVVGTIDTSGEVRRLRTIDRRFKVEGVHASIDTGVLDLLFVCDQDDGKRPSPLLSATMPLDGSVER